MTAQQRLERDLPMVLDDLATGPYPDYIDDVLAASAVRRQRPAWTFPERWIPMDITTHPVAPPLVRWRVIGVAALVALVIASAVAVYIGTRPRVPEPFGLAANGLIADDADGDIRTIDPVTGEATVIVSGPEVDTEPWFSRDGTRLVFRRAPAADDDTTLLFSVGVDGSGLTRLTPDMLTDLRWYEFTPDNTAVIIKSRIDGVMRISLAATDGSGLRTFEDVPVADDGGLALRPPMGREVLFTTVPGLNGVLGGISSLDLATGVVTEVIAGQPDVAPFGDIVWSPIGDRFAYGLSHRRANVEVLVADADGSADHVVGAVDGAQFVGWPQWSPDGRLLLVERRIGQDAVDKTRAVQPVVLDVDTGTETIIDTEITNGAGKEWAPDGTVIVAQRIGTDGSPLPQELWDVTTGSVTPAPWESRSYPAWQRVAR